MIPEVVMGIGLECCVVDSISVVKFELTTFIVAVAIHMEAVVHVFVKLLDAIWGYNCTISLFTKIYGNKKVIIGI